MPVVQGFNFYNCAIVKNNFLHQLGVVEVKCPVFDEDVFAVLKVKFFATDYSASAAGVLRYTVGRVSGATLYIS